VIRQENAAEMSAAARLAEIGSLLALGYRRSLAPRPNCLDDCPPVERQCEPPVDAGGDNPTTNQEIA